VVFFDLVKGNHVVQQGAIKTPRHRFVPTQPSLPIDLATDLATYLADSLFSLGAGQQSAGGGGFDLAIDRICTIGR
jgi:hypothetical protein